jgi:sulfhydrogenase subunit beta (sulfur reductase)
MENYFLKDKDLNSFVENIMNDYPIIAPVAKRNRFIFTELKSPKNLRLDYDTTILPPKKVFFPPKQTLFYFDGDQIDNAINPKKQVLFGVHPYDIKAIRMLDILFAKDYEDNNYLANREATTIIGSNVQKHYKHAFFGTQARDFPLTGHDMFITKITNGYNVEVLTDKGRELLEFDSFQKSSEAQIEEAEEVNKWADDNCPEKLNHDSEEIRKKVRNAFGYGMIWREMSEKCFSCSSCNNVCPTCYCFDVLDEWYLDPEKGERYRRWDGCMALEFAKVSVQGGSENFREKKAQRFRHRIMRKACYLNPNLEGSPACVGCGRCSGTCPPDIANPARIINRIMED